MSDKEWFENLFIKAAEHFGKLQADKISESEWEVRMLKHAMENDLLSWNDHLIRVSKTKKSYNLFTMNREYLIQFATYASLVYEYNYLAEDCNIEYEMMDILVKKNGKPFIYVETKVKNSEMDSLLKGILHNSGNVIPVPPKTKDDAMVKTYSIFKSKPAFFWLLNANQKWAYSIEHHDKGFILSRISDIPRYTQNESEHYVGHEGKEITNIPDKIIDTFDLK